MKFSGGFWALFSLLILQFGLAGCKRSPEPEPLSETALEEPTPTPAPTPTPTPAPTATPAPPSTEAAAPKNFHLKRRISVTHDAGIVGIPAGTIVTILEQKGDRLLVSANGMKIQVAATDITQNPDEVPSLIPVPPAPGDQSKGGPAAVVPTTPSSTPDARAAERAAKNQQIYQLRQEIARLSARRRELYDQLSQMRNPDRTPEGKARKAEVRQIGLTIDQLYIQIRHLSR